MKSFIRDVVKGNKGPDLRVFQSLKDVEEEETILADGKEYKQRSSDLSGLYLIVVDKTQHWKEIKRLLTMNNKNLLKTSYGSSCGVAVWNELKREKRWFSDEKDMHKKLKSNLSLRELKSRIEKFMCLHPYDLIRIGNTKKGMRGRIVSGYLRGTHCATVALRESGFFPYICFVYYPGKRYHEQEGAMLRTFRARFGFTPLWNQNLNPSITELS